MFRLIIKTLLIVLLSSSANAQSGHKINFEIDGYKNDTLIIGFYYGKSQRVLDTIYSPKKNGKFELTGTDTLKHGTYLALVKPDNTYFQFMVNNDQTFKMNNNIKDLNDMEVKGSDENKIFYNYLHYLKQQNKKVSEMNKGLDSLSSKQDSINYDKALTKIDAEVKKEQRRIIDLNPKGLTSLLIKIDLDIPLPEFTGTTKEKQLKRYEYIKHHYFDHIDLSDDMNIAIPGFYNKINNYIDKWTPNYPDSIINSIDFMMPKMENAKETYKYFISSFINRFGTSRIIGQDAIYVHLARNYYGNGKTPWAEKKTIKKILREAQMMAPSLIGKTAANVKLYKEDSTTVNLHEINARFSVLLFWSPTCGHCKKEMPEVIKFQEEYVEKGVKVIAICTKHQEDYKKCWDAVKKQNMENFLNLGDENHLSRFKLKFNVRQTPKIFVLDRDKKIILKNFPMKKLGEVIDSLIEEEDLREKNLLKEKGE